MRRIPDIISKQYNMKLTKHLIPLTTRAALSTSGCANSNFRSVQGLEEGGGGFDLLPQHRNKHHKYIEYAMKTLKLPLTRAALITGGRANINSLSVMKPTRLIRRSFLAKATTATHFLSRTMSLGLGALALGVIVAAQAAAPIITSFSGNGVLVCRDLAAGSVAAVEWASSATGPWTNNWAGLEAVTADTNGKIQVSVPMFYRVCSITNSDISGMALIPAGPFVMGDSVDGPSSALHTNQISAFYMDRFEVTKALWGVVYQWAITNGYTFNEALGKAPNHPAYSMTWYDAVKWCNARSEQQGRVPAYYINTAQTLVYRTGQVDVQTNWVKWSSGYRLPTEAEWEKAARGGASGQRFPWSETDRISHSQAHYDANYNASFGYSYDLSYPAGYHPTFNDGIPPYTSPVGYFVANANGYGLYDMAGNVNEWCWDWYDSYSNGSQTDPHGPASGSYRVIRGGGWNGGAFDCRAAYRGHSYPAGRSADLGFRSVLPPGH